MTRHPFLMSVVFLAVSVMVGGWLALKGSVSDEIFYSIILVPVVVLWRNKALELLHCALSKTT